MGVAVRPLGPEQVPLWPVEERRARAVSQIFLTSRLVITVLSATRNRFCATFFWWVQSGLQSPGSARYTPHILDTSYRSNAPREMFVQFRELLGSSPSETIGGSEGPVGHARSDLRAMSRPYARGMALVLLSGRPGAGKTAFAKWLAAERGFIHVDTDSDWNTLGSLVAAQSAEAATEAFNRARDLGPNVVIEWGFRLEYFDCFAYSGPPGSIPGGSTATSQRLATDTSAAMATLHSRWPCTGRRSPGSRQRGRT